MSVRSPNIYNVAEGGTPDWYAFGGYAFKLHSILGGDVARQHYLVQRPTAIRDFLGYNQVVGIGHIVPVVAPSRTFRGDAVGTDIQPDYQRIPQFLRPKSSYS